MTLPNSTIQSSYNFTSIHWKAQYVVNEDITRTNPACYPIYIKWEDSTLRILQFYSKQEIIWNTRNWSHSIHGLHLADCHALNHELKFKTFTKVSNTSPSYLAPFSPSFMFLTFSVSTSPTHHLESEFLPPLASSDTEPEYSICQNPR